MEFEFRPDGRLRYANNSNYKNDIMIRKEGTSFSRCEASMSFIEHARWTARRRAVRARRPLCRLFLPLHRAARAAPRPTTPAQLA